MQITVRTLFGGEQCTREFQATATVKEVATWAVATLVKAEDGVFRLMCQVRDPSALLSSEHGTTEPLVLESGDSSNLTPKESTTCCSKHVSEDAVMPVACRISPLLAPINGSALRICASSHVCRVRCYQARQRWDLSRRLSTPPSW